MASVHLLEAEVLEQQSPADEHFVLTLDAPEIAAAARPGQFVMVRALGWDPLLPRAYSVYHADAEGGFIEIMYRVAGRGTERLSRLNAGDFVSLWGPLGNTFEVGDNTTRAVLVGGGVGVPPIVYWAQLLEMAPLEVHALIGAASKRYLAGLDRLRAAGARVRVATDDGSLGHQGYVTELIAEAVSHAPAPIIYACGPMPMLRATARAAAELGVPCQLALEAPMACGVGACIGCTVPITGGGFRRVCTDGPVFAGESIEWEQVHL